MDPAELRERVEASVREHELVPPGGELVCLVSGGADSTCLWHVMRALGYRVSAVHVNHGLRGAESEEDARFCRDLLGAEVIDAGGSEPTSEAALREVRYRVTEGRGLRATGHTASDQVETVLYRLVARGEPGAIERRRADGVVRPLLDVWRDETEAYCRAEGLEFRLDTSNPDTARGLIRGEILPLLRRLHPDADRNLLRAGAERRLPQTRRGAPCYRCSPLVRGRSGSTLAPASRPYVSTTRSGWSRGPWRLQALSVGVPGRSNPSFPACMCEAGAQVTGWQGGA